MASPLSLCCFALHVGSFYNLEQEFSAFVVAHLIPAERYEEGLVSVSPVCIWHTSSSFLLFSVSCVNGDWRDREYTAENVAEP